MPPFVVILMKDEDQSSEGPGSLYTNSEMVKTSATYLSVLVFVEGHSVGSVLINVDTVFPLLAKFEVLADTPLHHHILAATCADTGDVTLRINYQHLWKNFFKFVS